MNDRRLRAARVSAKKLQLSSEVLANLALSTKVDATNSSQCNGCSCEQRR